MRTKTLLALALATGLLNQQLPGKTQDAFPSQTANYQSALDEIARSNKGTPERRAYYLLSIADSYLDGRTKAEVDSHYRDIDDLLESRRWMHKSWDHFLERWLYPSESTIHSKIIGKDESGYAEKAIAEALKQLNQAKDEYSKLCMTYIASRLLLRLGNTNSSTHCDQVVQLTMQSYESSNAVTIEQARATIAICDSQAFLKIPLRIHDWQHQLPVKVLAQSEGDFAECQKLKLRALAIADKLQTGEHVRRKAHRDLALWYKALGHEQLANKEKQALFKLVDCNEEEILNPQAGMCGHLVWWQKERITRIERCGMG